MKLFIYSHLPPLAAPPHQAIRVICASDYVIHLGANNKIWKNQKSGRVAPE